MLQVLLFILPTLAMLSVLIFLERGEGGSAEQTKPSGRKVARKRARAKGQ